MLMQQTGNRRGNHLLFLLLLSLVLLLAPGLVSCGSASQTSASVAPAGSPTASTPTPSVRQAQTASAPTAVPTPKPGGQNGGTPQPTTSTPVLHGSANFLLATPFNFVSVNGATTDNNGVNTPLAASSIKTEIIQELKHLLFVVDNNDNIKVYSQGAKPISAQVVFNSDGSASISYTQTADSEAGSVSILFSGLLSTKQIEVSYEQQYTPSILINAQASDIAVAFAAPVKWVAPNEIPAAPSNGTTQLTSQGGVVLAWSAGQNAVAYDVYRLISDQSQQFQLLATVKGTSYSDSSSETLKNIHSHKGITYAIFSVGSTGVENPGGIILSV